MYLRKCIFISRKTYIKEKIKKGVTVLQLRWIINKVPGCVASRESRGTLRAARRAASEYYTRRFLTNPVGTLWGTIPRLSYMTPS